MLTILHNDDIEKLSHLFRTCHAVAMKKTPFSEFVWLCELVRQNGVKLGKTYMNEESAKEFSRQISEIEREKLRDDIKITKTSSMFLAYCKLFQHPALK